MVGHHAGNLPRTHLREGLGEHLLVLVLSSQPTGTLALDQLPCRPGGEAAPQPVRVRWGRPSSGVDPRASHPRPTPAPSLPFRPPAGSRPRRPRTTAAHRTHAPNGDGPPHRAPDPARCGQRAAEPRTPKARPSGHLDCAGRMDTGRMDTGRPRDRLDGRPHGGQRTRTGDDRRGRRSDILATGDHPLGGQTSPGSQRLGALGHP